MEPYGMDTGVAGTSRTEAGRFDAGAAYVGGRFVPVAEAAIPVTDWGFTRSDAVYDVVHVFNGRFFRLADHLQRFSHSMQARRLAPPEDLATMEAVLHRCVALAGFSDAYVAMVASRGRPRVAGSRRPADCSNHFIAYALPWIDVIPKEVQERGAHLWIASTPRVPDASVNPTVKNYQWSDLTTGLFEAHDNGCDTAVLCDADGFVTEGPGFNVFVVREGRVLTPDRGALHGITRRSVLELCEQSGIPAAVAAITRGGGGRRRGVRGDDGRRRDAGVPDRPAHPRQRPARPGVAAAQGTLLATAPGGLARDACPQLG